MVDFGWSGAGAGLIEFRLDGTWELLVPSGGSGTWSGVANECFTGKTQDVGAGTGTVSLSGSPEVASLIYNVDAAGTVILVRYKTNPGGTPPKQALEIYIQVDSNIVDRNIAWPVELRVYYTDAEVAAAGIVEGTLKLYKWDGTNWTVVSDTGEAGVGSCNATYAQLSRPSLVLSQPTTDGGIVHTKVFSDLAESVSVVSVC